MIPKYTNYFLTGLDYHRFVTCYLKLCLSFTVHKHGPSSHCSILASNHVLVNPVLHLTTVIICLPLRETYIGLGSVYVRPSVPNASLVRAISPRIVNVEFSNFFPNNILTKVVQQKIKIQIFPNILKFWPKNYF